MNKKIFNFDNLSESTTDKKVTYSNAISAGGCLFFRKSDQHLLLIEYADPKWSKLDDFGGKVDIEDETIRRILNQS